MLAAVASNQRRIRILSGLACALGLLSAAASIVIIFFYFSAYRPKQLQVMNELGARSVESVVVPSQQPQATGEARRYDFASVNFAMTHAVGMGTMLVATAVGLLALGTIVLLLVVIFTRRATLAHIQASLAQISAQLQLLRLPESR